MGLVCRRRPSSFLGNYILDLVYGPATVTVVNRLRLGCFPSRPVHDHRIQTTLRVRQIQQSPIHPFVPSFLFRLPFYSFPRRSTSRNFSVSYLYSSRFAVRYSPCPNGMALQTNAFSVDIPRL